MFECTKLFVGFSVYKSSRSVGIKAPTPSPSYRCDEDDDNEHDEIRNTIIVISLLHSKAGYVLLALN